MAGVPVAISSQLLCQLIVIISHLVTEIPAAAVYHYPDPVIAATLDLYEMVPTTQGSQLSPCIFIFPLNDGEIRGLRTVRWPWHHGIGFLVLVVLKTSGDGLPNGGDYIL